MTIDALCDAICDVVRSTLPGSVRVTQHSLAADIPGWDSHATVEIIFRIEDRFGFAFSSAEMESVDGIASLAEIVSARPVALPAS